MNPEATTKLFAIGNMFNSAGKMVKDGLVEPEFIWQFHSPFSILLMWEKVKPLVDKWREIWNDSSVWESFEYLYDITKNKHPDVKV
jgi:hypothetical protein